MSNSTTVIKRAKTYEMRHVVVSMLKGYHTFVSPLLHQTLGFKTACRSFPDCSEYAQTAITQHGIGRGMLLSVRRLINCQPFFKI